MNEVYSLRHISPNLLSLYYLVIGSTFIYITYKNRNDSVSFLIILLFYNGLFTFLGKSVENPYKIITLIVAFYAIIKTNSFNFTNKLTSNLLFLFIFFTLIFLSTGLINKNRFFLLFSQYSKYLIPFLFTFIMVQYSNFDKQRLDRIGILFISLLTFQIYFSIIKFFLFKPMEPIVGSLHFIGGAAATVGILDAVARLQLPVHVYGIVAACENMPSGSALKPGDVIKTMSGKTVEVANTDAEGRLILADALHYACSLKPDAIIDLATLTGAIVIALGAHAMGLFSNDDVVSGKLKAAADLSGEKVWQLPVWDDYQADIKSEIADIKNIGLPMEAGSITAAMFLKAFVNDIPWAHLDIASTAWTDARKGTSAKGATGAGVRLVTKFIENWGK